ncbi:MAG: DUF1538 domain-containing protein [Fibrobacter sp.]|nr:DUF1538 domain-containing protein [Fibrobacter sp.]
MLSILFEKLKEAFTSVLPVSLIVLVMSFTPLVSFTHVQLAAFSLCSVILVLGIGLFNLGADLAMTPMGEYVGSGLAKSRRLLLLVSVCFIMGVLITVAEPDLSVLAEQVKNAVVPWLLIVTVGVGVGLFLLLSIFKIVFKRDLSTIIIFFYMVLFMFGMLMVSMGRASFVPLAFDSGGVTTGPITVPFIMALGVGVAGAIGGRHAGENSFGLIALCSIGPILALMGLLLLSKGDLEYNLVEEAYSIDVRLSAISSTFFSVAEEVVVALGLIVVFFVILQLTILKLAKAKLIKIAIGIIYTFVGLVLFLTAVAVGFMPIGFELGQQLSQTPRALLISGFVIGMVVVLAEPAVHVLNKQVEEITGGLVTKRSMLIALSVGVGVSIGLSMLRIIWGFPLIYYLIPGYFLSLGLSFFVPKIYTAIAFDSGGVASGPLTSSFILPLAIGACAGMHDGGNSILDLAFGVVAMVAMTPLITIQVLGFKAVVSRYVRNRIMMRRIQDADDEQIIDFI